MDFVNTTDANGHDKKINIHDFQGMIRGIERNDSMWPEIRCIACSQAAFARGVVVPNPDYTPHFSHYHKADNPEVCPLSTGSKRLRGFAKSTDPEQAREIRRKFFQFDTLREAYLVCRELRGGAGKLSQAEFIKMVNVADSFNIWAYKDMTLWGITILMMLMANHPTPNGKAAFFYAFDKGKTRLVAHWVSSGKPIQPPGDGVNPSFRHEISYLQDTVSEIIKGQNLSFWQRDKLTALSALDPAL